MFNNFQNIIVRLGIVALVAKIAIKCLLIYEDFSAISHDSKYSVLITKSLFIDIYDFVDEDGSFPPNVVVHVSMNL